MSLLKPTWAATFKLVLGALLLTSTGVSLSLSLPMATTDDAERRDAVEASAEFPLRYAVGLTPSLESIDVGSGGVTVFSAGAHSLGLRISLQNWPSDQPLQWRSAAPEVVHHITPGSNETRWLPDVPGDMASLRWEAEALPSDARLTLELVYHGYRGIYGVQARAAGDSGACNIDVACPEANSWNDPVRATVLITVGNGLSRSLCSGALLNNTANDGRPLLITARHCGVTPNNAASMNTVFNFQRSNCGGGDDGDDMRDMISGSTWLGESARADTTLVVLGSDVPNRFGAALGAWSAAPATPTSGVSIHHPAGDQKKISLYSTAATATDRQCISGVGLLGQCSGFTVDAWRVQWRRGVTEGGSSGSGLWNQNRALVGVLSGGASACSSPNGNDFFGRLAAAWDDSAAIRNALDPVSGGTSRSSDRRGSSGASEGGGGSLGGGVLLLLGIMAWCRRGIRRRW